MNNNICYIIEITNEGENYYVFNRRILLHNSDMGRKFLTMKQAYNFYKSSPFYKNEQSWRVLKYNKATKEIIY